MSATNRGAKRATSDFYPTPEWCTRVVLERAVTEYIVFDPCAGDGAILRVAKELGREVWAKEIRPECESALQSICGRLVVIGDALRNPAFGQALVAEPAAVVTNPPYSLAREFIDVYTRRYRKAAFLLRLNFLGSQQRAHWWIANPPAKVLVLSRRPSFTGKGTDATEYAWFVWDGFTASGETRIEVVP